MIWLYNKPDTHPKNYWNHRLSEY